MSPATRLRAREPTKVAAAKAYRLTLKLYKQDVVNIFLVKF